MAPSMRAKRQRDIASAPQLSAATAPLPSDSKNPSNDRESNNTGHEPDGTISYLDEVLGVLSPVPQTYDPDTYDPEGQIPWTPEPEPYDPETYAAWGRKHFGDDWFEQRKTMLEERNFYISRDQVYEERRRTLRVMEDERQTGKLPLKGKTWQELMAWARMHYGEVWYQQRKILDRLDREEEEISDPEEKKKISSKWRKCRDIISDVQLDTDEAMLAEGKTWHDIMAFPVNPSNIAPSIETGGYTIRSPSPSSDGSGYNTYPPTPTETRIEAQNGPHGPEHEWEWRWELLEWRAVHWRWTEEEYEGKKLGLRASIRSSREDEDGDRRREEELEEIRRVKYLPGILIKSGEYEDRMRKFDLRAQGWTQEQIEAADRADTAAREWRHKNPEPRGSGLLGQAITQEERDVYDTWLQKERAARLRIYGELPPRSKSGPLGQYTQEEKDAYDTWRRNIHARVSSQHEQEPGADATADASAPEKASRLRAPTPRATKNISRKTRGGRIPKNKAQSQSVDNRGTQSQRTAPKPVQASIANRQSKRAKASDVVDKPNESTAQVPQKTRKTQPKVDKKRASDAVEDIDDQGLQSKSHNTRQRSRRLAGRLPEYGMLPKRGEPAPPYEPPSDTRKPNSSGLRNRAPPKKSITVKGAKPQGISKSGREGTNRSKRSKKRLED